MNILIVGLGSIGQRHLANVRTLQPDAFVTVWHHRPMEGPPPGPPVDRTVFKLEDALDLHPDMALVCGPATTHVERALALAREGIHVFIEKPLSNDLAGVEELIRLCDERDLVLMVGYNLRFLRSLAAIRQAIDDERIGRIVGLRGEVGMNLQEWRPGRDYRRGVSARSELGGGVLRELSHELDYARWLVGEVSAVSAMTAQTGELDVDVEDIAEIILRFENGAVGNLHLDMVQRSPVRRCRVLGTEGILEWDGIEDQARLRVGVEEVALNLDGASNRNEMYLEELRHFVDCVRSGSKPLVSGEDGKRVVEIFLAAEASSRSGTVVTL